MSTFISIILPLTCREFTSRCLAVLVVCAIAVPFAHFYCADRPMELSSSCTSWWLCGIAGTYCAATVAGWFGFRCLILIPLLIVPTTWFFTILCMYAVESRGYQIEALRGFGVTSLGILAGVGGTLAVLPVFSLRRYRTSRNGGNDIERESFSDDFMGRWKIRK